jgi:S1-C subfamily serine protease
MTVLKPAMTFLVICMTFSPQAFGQESLFNDEVINRLAEVLSARKFDDSGIRTRGRADVFSKSVRSVPFVISGRGSGSSVVIRTIANDSTAWVVTNEHVVGSPFRDERGRAFVLVVFYDPQLVSEPFNRDRIRTCQRYQQDSTGWCKAFQQSVRPAAIAGVDVARDLALLVVPSAPKGVTEIPFGQIDGVRPGDDVVVLGHPLDLLWSLTTGIVSAVRHQFPTGTPPQTARSTVIQTQAPVNPGNSGGPLLTAEGRLIGVVFGQGVAGRIQMPYQGQPQEAEIAIPASGLNFAIGINEVQGFVSELTEKSRR